MKETIGTEVDAVAAEPAMRGPAALEAPAQVARMLALQRTAGNRAVGRMLAATPAPRATLARDTTTVSEWVKEERENAENVTWTANFDVNFGSDTKTCWATIKVKLKPDDGISKDDVDWVKIGVISRFSLLWGSKFSFHEKHSWPWSDEDWVFRPGIEFVDSGQHLTVNLHAGKGGPGYGSNRTNWYVMKPEYNEDKSKEVPADYGEFEHAHEISHQMGLLDEYEDASIKNRKVYKDNSLMGDYANEGFRKMEVKRRHGERMADIIGRATGRKLTLN